MTDEKPTIEVPVREPIRADAEMVDGRVTVTLTRGTAKIITEFDLNEPVDDLDAGDSDYLVSGYMQALDAAVGALLEAVEEQRAAEGATDGGE